MARSTTRAPAEQTACSGSKTVFYDAGQQVGKVEDLIIAPGKDVSSVIVGAGGFVGIGRHDVAIPLTRIQDKAGKLVLPGATTDNKTDTSTG